MALSSEQMADLRELANSRDVTADVALRARIVLWSGEGRRRKDIAELAGVSPVTVDRCKARYTARGLSGLEERRRGGGRDQLPPQVRGRVIALTKMSPPAESGRVGVVEALRNVEEEIGIAFHGLRLSSRFPLRVATEAVLLSKTPGRTAAHPGGLLLRPRSLRLRARSGPLGRDHSSQPSGSVRLLALRRTRLCSRKFPAPATPGERCPPGTPAGPRRRQGRRQQGYRRR